jgi:Zn-dependent metalloprotease
MKTKFMLLIAVLLICQVSADAQNNKKVSDTIYTVDKVIPSYLIPTSTEAINNCLKVLEYRENRNILESLLSLNENTTAVLVDTLTDFAGGYHESYKEYYNGIEVEGTRCTIHYDPLGNITSINGNFRMISQLNTVPSINESSALQYALNDVAAEKYSWEDPVREQILKIIKNNSNATNYPKGKLVIFTSSDVISLAYKFNIQSSSPHISQYIYVNAEDGCILGKFNAECNISATASVSTRYSGQRTITTDSYLGSYRLRDNNRGNGIITLDYETSNDYYSTNNTWSNMSNYDRIALDVHWGVETTYDYYLNKFNRNSYNNNGALLLSFVNAPNYPNSGWSSSGHIMIYGVDSINQPYVDLDVVAHEYTHAVTDNSSNLNDAGESGAINEGLSDVMAVCVENEAKPNNGQMIWVIGENIRNGGLRDMRYPECKFYYGTDWADVTNNGIYNDYGGIHTNLGVFNYWFYLLANGGSGTNEIGIDYDIDGIGLDQAIRICYLMNTAYLTSNSDFTDACRCSYLAATQLGYIDIIEQIKEAWIAVGVELPSNVTIIGQDMLCSQGAYQVSNLPSFYSVVWYLSGTNASDFSLSFQNGYCSLNTANYNIERTVTLNANIMRNG